jgi:hypothetical protein
MLKNQRSILLIVYTIFYIIFTNEIPRMRAALTILVLIIVHLNATCQIQWQKSFGGFNEDEAYSIYPTSDSGYIVAGYTESNDGDVSGYHGNGDCWVIKLSPAGSLQWQKSLGGTNGEFANSVIQTYDNGYIIAGGTSSDDGDVSGNHGGSDIWLVKLSAAGTLQWQKCFGGSANEAASSVVQTSDSGFIVAGTSSSNDGDVSGNHGSRDWWVIKLSASGILQWQRSLGGTFDDQTNSIIQTYDGGYIATGYTYSNDGDVSGNHGAPDAWIVKLSATGSIQWQKCIGGSDGDIAQSIVQTTDSGFIFSGYTYSNDGDVSRNHGWSDVWVVKLSSAGILQWQQCLGGTGTDIANSIVQVSDGGYLVAGYTGSAGEIPGYHGREDSWIIKLSHSGSTEWQKCFGGSNPDHAFAVCQALDGNYIFAGYTTSTDGDISGPGRGSYDYWIVKFGAVTEVNSIISSSAISITPNPTNGPISIKGVPKANIRIYNVVGQLINQTTNVDNVSIAKQPSGTYFIELFNDDKQLIRRDKIIKY